MRLLGYRADGVARLPVVSTLNFIDPYMYCVDGIRDDFALITSKYAESLDNESILSTVSSSGGVPPS